MSEGAEVVIVTRPGVPALPGSVQNTVASFQANVLPQPAEPPDASASTFWHVYTSADQANDLISRLIELPEVEGAYLKPPDSMP